MNDLLIPDQPKKFRCAAVTMAMIGIAIASVAYGEGKFVASMIPVQTGSLGACERNTDLFGDDVGKEDTIIDAWSAEYHERVRTIIDEHVAFLETGGACLEENARPPAEPELKKDRKSVV